MLMPSLCLSGFLRVRLRVPDSGGKRSQGFEVLPALHLFEVSLLFCLLYLESFSGRGEKNGLSDIIKTLKVKLKKQALADDC